MESKGANKAVLVSIFYSLALIDNYNKSRQKCNLYIKYTFGCDRADMNQMRSLQRYVQLFVVYSLTFILCTAALAGDFEDGMSALKNNDKSNGLKLLKRAAQNGNPLAAYNLGLIHLDGRLMKADFHKAKDWFEASAHAGNTSAQNALGVLLSFRPEPPNNPADGFKWLKKAYENGHLKSGYYVAKSYFLGKGVAKNINFAIGLWKATGKQGLADSLNELGVAHLLGNGVPKNIVTANAFWQQGAEKENIPSLYNLGHSYELGRGVGRDYSKAAEYYSRSANLGHYWPMYRLARLLEKGSGLPKNEALAAKWYSRAARKKYPPAVFALARLTDDGRGVRQDAARAKALYKLAARLGHPKAKEKLAEAVNLPSKKPKKGAGSFVPYSGPIVKYKGKLLIGSSYSGIDNKTFFDTVKFAIDMTEQLPKRVRDNIGFLKEIIYDPPSPHRAAKGIQTNIVGVYTITDMQNPPGPIVIYQDMKWSAPVMVAMSLLGNSIHAKRHVERISLGKKLNALKRQSIPDAEKYGQLKKRYDDLVADVEKTNIKIMERLACEPMRAEFEAMKIWELDPVRRDRLSLKISERNCWER